MNRVGRALPFALIVAASAHAAPAFATTEIPAPVDARTAGMGGTGTAAASSGASVYHNVATLADVKLLTATLAVAPSLPTITAPVGPNGASADTKGQVFPFFLVGAGVRVSDKVVLGLAAYPTGGFGGTYSLGGQDMQLQVATLEASPAVSYSITDSLSVGLGYRITYATETTEFPTGQSTPIKSSLSGASFLGAQLGVFWKPIDIVRLGAVYRTKTSTDVSGQTTIPGQTFDTTSTIATPHQFKVGASVEVIPSTLTLAADLKYSLYSESNKEIVTTSGGQETHQPLDWNNTISGGLGAEYFVLPIFAVRAGYGFSQSATPLSRPNPFLLPPGLVQSIHAGVGVRLPHIDVDLGGYYSFASKDVAPTDLAPDAAASPGRYAVSFLLGSLSATYRM